jgi:hypothetical protein
VNVPSGFAHVCDVAVSSEETSTRVFCLRAAMDAETRSGRCVTSGGLDPEGRSAAPAIVALTVVATNDKATTVADLWSIPRRNTPPANTRDLIACTSPSAEQNRHKMHA